MMLKTPLAAVLFVGAFAAQAQAVVPIVNPVTVNTGTPVHLTPRDQNGQPIPIAQCTLSALPTALVAVSYDPTGAVLTAVASGSAVTQWKCTDGTTTVGSTLFSVTVPPPPYAVTAVGDTMP